MGGFTPISGAMAMNDDGDIMARPPTPSIVEKADRGKVEGRDSVKVETCEMLLGEV